MRDLPPIYRRILGWPRTIRALAIGFAIVTALVTAILGRITLDLVHRQLELRLDTQIQLETRSLRDIARDRGFEALVATVQEREHDGINVVASHAPGLKPEMGYILLDRAGRRRAGNLNALVPGPGYTEFIHFADRSGRPGIAQGVNVSLPDGGRLVVAADRAVIHKIDTRVVRYFTAAFCIILAIGAIATFALSRIFRARLRAFERLALAVTAGNIDQRMPLDGSGVEFDRLSSVLNGMLDRIAALVANLRAVSTALAHDLRTPLSRIRARIERAEEVETDPAQKHRLGETVDDIDALLELFAGMLALSELDGQSIRNRFESVDLATALSDIGEAHRPAIEDSGRTLEIQVAPVRVSGDRALLQRLAGNLIDNAMVHTPAGTIVSLTVAADGTAAVIRVADDGPGVPEEDRSRIFDRLVRLDASRTSPGHGLGLSMVSAIVAAHGGTVAALPASKGLTIEIRLPALT